ncbi:MAG: hypothetical protein N0E55_12135, partial [Candidatus Thiodiazotropha taylori]|nr:hypothetical protein [Candidatus Thiodiazotropha taylori]MCW4253433.1 hypothetical protein [Candidatus Thiodiazotropha taylori]
RPLDDGDRTLQRAPGWAITRKVEREIYGTLMTLSRFICCKQIPNQELIFFVTSLANKTLRLKTASK